MDEKEIEEFFSLLAGEDAPRSRNELKESARALRHLVKLRHAWKDSFEAPLQSQEQAGAMELAARARALEYLHRRLAEQPIATRRLPSLPIALVRFLTGSRRPILVLCTFAAVSLISLRVWSPMHAPEDANVIRGGAEPTIHVDDAAKMTEALAEELRRVGADVVVVQINATSWSMNIQSGGETVSAKVQAILLARGLDIGDQGAAVRILIEDREK